MISEALAGSVSVPVGLAFAQSPESTHAPHVGYFCASFGFATVLLGTHHLRPPFPSCPMHAGILSGTLSACPPSRSAGRTDQSALLWQLATRAALAKAEGTPIQKANRPP